METDFLVNLDLVENSASSDIAKFLPKPKRNKSEPSATRPTTQQVPKPKKIARNENDETGWDDNAGHFWSSHPQGSNFLFADGHVKIVPYSVDTEELFPALGTRDGGEVADDY